MLICFTFTVNPSEVGSPDQWNDSILSKQEQALEMMVIGSILRYHQNLIWIVRNMQESTQESGRYISSLNKVNLWRQDKSPEVRVLI